MGTSQRQLAIIRHKDKYISVVLDGKELDHVIVEEQDDAALRVGDVYIGRVSHIVKNINAVFVEVKKGVMCYVPRRETCGKKPVQGQEITVQIRKAAVKSKQAGASCKLEFSGKYAVVATGGTAKRISAKITDEKVCARLKQLLEPFQEEPFNIILRTCCESAPDGLIQDECSRLLREASDIVKKSETRACFTKLYQPEMEAVRFARDMGRGFFDRIITDERDLYDKLMKAEALAGENIVFYDDSFYPLDKLLGIRSKLVKALGRHVWLKSGASLVIEPTEALTVIDVNTEKAVNGKRNSETTFFKINMEAAREAARQIRIRNISGIILIDFIDMKEKEHIHALMNELENEFRKDSVKTALVDMTKLGIVEITRMKLRKPLWESIDRRDIMENNP